MIYSNLTCFYQIKFIFVQDCWTWIAGMIFFYFSTLWQLAPFPLHPLFFCSKRIFHHFVINVNICNRLDWIKRDRKSSTNNFPFWWIFCVCGIREKHQNLLTYRFLRVENLHLNDILGNHHDFFQPAGVCLVAICNIVKEDCTRKKVSSNFDEVSCLLFGPIKVKNLSSLECCWKNLVDKYRYELLIKCIWYFKL